MKNPFITIVILNWNGIDDTLACLSSLAALMYPNFNVIVVDNGSTDDSLDKLRAYRNPYPLIILETGCNLGYAGGNNVGMKHAVANGADYVLVLNNDTEVAPDLLDRLVEAAQAHPDVGIFGPRVYYHHDPKRIWFARGVWNEQTLYFSWPGQGRIESEIGAEECETDYVTGAALMFSAEVARRIGYFDERFFLVFEESDWCYRARKAGYRLRMISSAKVWHKIGVSFGSENSPLRAYFSARNVLLWNQLHLPVSPRLRYWRKVLKRIVPPFSISKDKEIPWLKRFFWGGLQYWKNWKNWASDPLHQAFRWGVRDYLLRRFGDCPAEIRTLSAAWIRSRA